jgi:hypothetical protein
MCPLSSICASPSTKTIKIKHRHHFDSQCKNTVSWTNDFSPSCASPPQPLIESQLISVKNSFRNKSPIKIISLRNYDKQQQNSWKQQEMNHLLGKMPVVGTHWCTTDDPARNRRGCRPHCPWLNERLKDNDAERGRRKTTRGR